MRNMPKIQRFMKKTTLRQYMQAGKILWNKLSYSERKMYEDMHSNMLEEYFEAMDEFKAVSLTEGNHILEAVKERRSFKTTIRRKLKKSKLIPIFRLNCLNLFFKYNMKSTFAKTAPLWNNASKEQRQFYKDLAKKDLIRYYHDKAKYEEMIQEIINHLLTICSDSDLKSLKRGLK